MAQSARSWIWFATLALACLAAPGPVDAQSQTAAVEASDVAAAPAGKLFSDQELDELVARIALYPDPLLALVMPASTNALQIVQAQRRLDANTGEEPPSDWDPAIISLMNYPEVVQMMSDDLDWTEALGDAVAAQQADVMDAVQQVRAQAQAAGNLSTTEQQKVIVEKEVVKIVPADPQVIYVPQYNPQVVYLPSPVPVVSYYPPRPCYWCPAAAFGASMFIGAAITAPFWAFDWHHHDIGWGHHGGGHNDFDFDIDRSININNNISNVNKNVVNKGNGNQWKPDKNRPGNKPGGGNANRPNRPEGGWNNPNRPGAGGSGRPSTQPGDRPGAGGGGAQRPGAGGSRPGAGGGGVQRPGGGKDRPGGVAGQPSTRPAGGGKDRPGTGSGGGTRPSTRPGSQKPTRDPQGMGSYERGRDSVKESNRGASSRQHSSTGSSRQGSGSGGGSYKGSGGGGGHSMSGYKGGGHSSAHSSRGSGSRGGGGGHGGGGGGRGGGGGHGGGGGGGRRR